jgi:hypothetical protein
MHHPLETRETLPNFNKKKAPKKRREKETRTKVQASKQPKRGRPQGGNGTTKY